MSKRDLEESYPVIVRCAVLISGLSSDKLKAKDVMFNVDLVKSIFRSSNHFRDFDLQTTQVLRLFDKYSAKGWAEPTARGTARSYRLSAPGMFEIMASLVTLDFILPVAEAVFLQWFLDAYRDFIRARLAPHLGQGDVARLDTFLARHFVFGQQVRLIEQGIQDMRVRIRESQNLQDYLRRSRENGRDYLEALKEMPYEFSYRLSHQKRFWQWIEDLPAELRGAELERGVAQRERDLYRRSVEFLELTRDYYQKIMGKADE